MQRREFLAMGVAATAAATLPHGARAATTGDLKGDVDILRRALALHPGLYRYNSPRGIEARLAAFQRAFVAAPDQAAQFLILSRFLAMVRCGHTQCNPYNQSNAVVAALFDRPTRLPFTFAWIDRQMVVLSPPREAPEIVRGSTITRLNGMAPTAMLAALTAYSRADGSNDAKRVAQMAMRDTDRYETFDIFQGLAFPPAGREHAVEYRTPAGMRRRASLPALSLSERQARSPALDTSQNDKPFWSWRMEGEIAVLTMPTWVMYNTKWDWERWLDERLGSLGGARGLVIDLRDNEGGNECGNAILARLTARDLSFPGYEQRIRYRRTPPDLDRYLDTWDRSFRTIGTTAVDIGNGFLRLGGAEPSDTIPAKGPQLTLPVAALVGPVCSSATYSFARRARFSGLVKLYGGPTGGNLRGINGNGYFFVRLPASGLEFDIPIIGNFPVTPQPDQGVMPNVAVAPIAADIAVGRDPAMMRAVADLLRG
jgi:hypothetical protein